MGAGDLEAMRESVSPDIEGRRREGKDRREGKLMETLEGG